MKIAVVGAGHTGLPNAVLLAQHNVFAIVDGSNTRRDFCETEILKFKPCVAGSYQLVMKARCGNYRASSFQGIMKRFKARRADVMVYEPALTVEKFYSSNVAIELAEFKKLADVIAADRFAENHQAVAKKVFSPELFGQD